LNKGKEENFRAATGDQAPTWKREAEQRGSATAGGKGRLVAHEVIPRKKTEKM